MGVLDVYNESLLIPGMDLAQSRELQRRFEAAGITKDELLSGDGKTGF